jgi:hypothetical protein
VTREFPARIPTKHRRFEADLNRRKQRKKQREFEQKEAKVTKEKRGIGGRFQVKTLPEEHPTDSGNMDAISATGYR